jgi:hypothetical protein
MSLLRCYSLVFLLTAIVLLKSDRLFAQVISPGGSSQYNAAQGMTREDAVLQTKQELQTVYRQWRQNNPNEPLTTEAFQNYLSRTPTLPSVLPVQYNSLKDKVGIPLMVLPSGGWIMELYPVQPASAIGIYMDINGNGQPNGYQFGNIADQMRFEIDAQGNVEVR